MRIALDAMGGDFAPQAIVAGAVQAGEDLPSVSKIFLVGDQDTLKKELDGYARVPSSLEIVHASEIVGMNEAPAVAIRRKKDSSIGRAVDMVKAGDADAVFSAGNTGAAVAATTLKLRTLKGIERPAIATVLPTVDKPCVLLDVGANPVCTPHMLVQFAIMGLLYSRVILGVESPRVGIVSIGEEAAKGNEVTKETYKIMSGMPLDFAGNVESSDLYEGRVDVAVCDGFVGNVMLKTSEAAAKAIGTWLKGALTATTVRKLGALLCRGAMREIKQHVDPATYGGAPLLGVNGVCIIGHGSSSAFAVRNGIRMCSESISHHLNQLIEDMIQEVKS